MSMTSTTYFLFVRDNVVIPTLAYYFVIYIIFHSIIHFFPFRITQQPSAFSLGDICVPPMANVLKVFLENGQTKSFKYDSTTKVQVSYLLLYDGALTHKNLSVIVDLLPNLSHLSFYYTTIFYRKVWCFNVHLWVHRICRLYVETFIVE